MFSSFTYRFDTEKEWTAKELRKVLAEDMDISFDGVDKQLWDIAIILCSTIDRMQKEIDELKRLHDDKQE